MTSDRDFAEADALWDFVANADQPPRTDVERTVRRVQGAMEADRTTPPMPRDRIWAEVVTSAARPPERPSPAASGFLPGGGWARRQVGRWQSVVSFGLMVAVLFSLLGIAHDRVMSPALATPAPVSIPAGSFAGESTPATAGACVARDVSWQEPEFRADPHYEAVRPAPTEIGEAALETYIAFSSCTVSNFDPNDPTASLAMTAFRSFVTDRLWATWTSSSPDYSGMTDKLITQSAVIPVNRPIATYSPPNEDDPREKPYVGVFWPSDVYELVDGRYGVVIGSITSDAFRSTGVETEDYRHQPLFWLAFVEQNGQLFIDEFGGFCTGEWVYMDGEGNPIATPMPNALPAGTTAFCRP